MVQQRGSGFCLYCEWWILLSLVCSRWQTKGKNPLVMIANINNYLNPPARWEIIGMSIMSTYKTIYQCAKCGAQVPTVQPKAGFWRGYGTAQLQDGPCPAGGSHDWHELTKGQWLPDDDD